MLTCTLTLSYGPRATVPLLALAFCNSMSPLGVNIFPLKAELSLHSIIRGKGFEKAIFPTLIQNLMENESETENKCPPP
jgi:hypothetical protein